MAQSGTTQTGTLRGFKEIDKQILNMMLENPEGLRAKFIIKHLTSPRRTIYRRLKILEKKGILENIYPIWKFQDSKKGIYKIKEKEEYLQKIKLLHKELKGFCIRHKLCYEESYMLVSTFLLKIIELQINSDIYNSEHLIKLHNLVSKSITLGIDTFKIYNKDKDRANLCFFKGNNGISLTLKKRWRILKKYNFCCYYCGRKPPEVELQLEHKQSKKNKGLDIDENLVPACKECNFGKSSDSV